MRQFARERSAVASAIAPASAIAANVIPAIAPAIPTSSDNSLESADLPRGLRINQAAAYSGLTVWAIRC